MSLVVGRACISQKELLLFTNCGMILDLPLSDPNPRYDMSFVMFPKREERKTTYEQPGATGSVTAWCHSEAFDHSAGALAQAGAHGATAAGM